MNTFGAYDMGDKPFHLSVTQPNPRYGSGESLAELIARYGDSRTEQGFRQWVNANYKGDHVQLAIVRAMQFAETAERTAGLTGLNVIQAITLHFMMRVANQEYSEKLQNSFNLFCAINGYSLGSNEQFATAWNELKKVRDAMDVKIS